jgi:hypothetical protein
MVKSEQYTCKLCDKQYSSASSIWNHRTKKHKVNKDYHDNHMIISDNPLIISDNDTSSNAIDKYKIYDCKYCKKQFKYFQNRWRHEKICKHKNSEIIEKDKNKDIIEKNNNTSIQTQNIITKNGNNNTNNGTINNETINNITINNYGNEDKSYISENFMLNIISKIIKNDDNIIEAMPNLIKNIHFNQNHKDNNNIKINNIRSSIARTYKNNKWMHEDKKKLLSQTHDNSVKFTENWADENKEIVPKNTKDKIKDYKQIHSKICDNKKKILDEITKLAYIYYKNYMEEKDEFELDK